MLPFLAYVMHIALAFTDHPCETCVLHARARTQPRRECRECISNERFETHSKEMQTTKRWEKGGGEGTHQLDEQRRWWIKDRWFVGYLFGNDNLSVWQVQEPVSGDKWSMGARTIFNFFERNENGRCHSVGIGMKFLSQNAGHAARAQLKCQWRWKTMERDRVDCCTIFFYKVVTVEMNGDRRWFNYTSLLCVVAYRIFNFQL